MLGLSKRTAQRPSSRLAEKPHVAQNFKLSTEAFFVEGVCATHKRATVAASLAKRRPIRLHVASTYPASGLVLIDRSQPACNQASDLPQRDESRGLYHGFH